MAGGLRCLRLGESAEAPGAERLYSSAVPKPCLDSLKCGVGGRDLIGLVVLFRGDEGAGVDGVEDLLDERSSSGELAVLMNNN